MNDNPELGYQYLATGFTGTYIPELSGHSVFPMISADMGSFMSTQDGESV